MRPAQKKLDRKVEILDSFIRMEKAEPSLVDNFFYNGAFNAWPAVRLRMMQNFSYSGEIDFSYYDDFIFYNFPCDYNICLSDATKNRLKRIKNNSLICITGDAYHSLNVEGVLWDQSIDPVFILAAQSGFYPIKMQLAENEKHARFIETLHIPCINYNKRNLDPDELQRRLPNYKDYLDACLDYKVAPLHISGIVQLCGFINAYAEVYFDIFSIMKPSCVCLSNYYETLNHGVILACYRAGVPSIEFQHGRQTKHFGYTFGHLPPAGFELFPKWWFVWGEAPKQHLEKSLLNSSRHHVASAGHPLYSVWKKGKIKDDPILVKALQADAKNKKVILYTMSDGGKIERDMIPELIRHSPDDWLWLIRDHPFFPTLHNVAFDERDMHKVNIDAATQLNLFTVLSYTDHCVTYSSSSILESIYLFGIPCTMISDFLFNTDPEFYGSIDLLAVLSDVDSIMNRILRCPGSVDNVRSNIPYIINDVDSIGRMLKIACACEK